MSNTIRRAALPLVALALITAACGGDAKTDEAARDIALTPTDTTKPMNDVAPAQTPAPETPAPTPAPIPQTKAPAPKPMTKAPAKAAPATSRAGVIAAGTSFNVTPGVKICTNTHKAGDRFTTTLAADVTGSNGAVIPAGATVTLSVVESAISKNSKDNWKLSFAVVSVTMGDKTLDVKGDVTKVATIEAVRSQSTGQQVGKVATGAAVGAIAGRLLGKDTKSTVVGAAVGAAAGGAVAAGTTDYEGCLAPTGMITIALTEALTVKAG
ncbi:MAG: hypothetical protein ACKVS7_02865 [Gemmatimonadaceae bacterium]